MSGAEANSIPPAIPPAMPIGDEGEPVHFADSIQPHGLLLVLSQPECQILRVSANTATYLGVQPQQLLGQSLQTLLEAQQFAAMQRNLPENEETADFLNLLIHTAEGDRSFDGRLYRSGNICLLELEPAQAIRMPLHQVKQAIDQLQRVSHLPEFLQSVAAAVRAMTGFDRVMLYQFDTQGAGAVVAEAKRQDLSPYLGLHYPATDIPKPVRALYQRSLLRYIPDLAARSVALIPAEHSTIDFTADFTADLTAEAAIDLSQSVLRSVDPCCVEYHQNMNVAAMLVISLVKDQTLWGLISCHHQTAKFLSSDVRTACELLGKFTAAELANKVDHAELDALLKLKALQSEWVESISQATDLRTALVNPAPRLLDLVNAQGAAVCLGDEITLVGATPTVEQVRRLMGWIDAQTSTQTSTQTSAQTSIQNHQPLFHTDSLPRLYPEAALFKETGSGLLRLRIAKIQRYSILWFRPEVLQTVSWAGDPNSAIQVQPDGTVMLGPRRSFAQWQETVRLTALPWKPYELEGALDLRNAIVGIVLHKADELAKINRELERSNQELDSFAYAASHDLKEPLRGIHNYSTLLLKGYAHVLDETGRNRLRTLLRLTRRMESLIDVLLKFSRLGQAELHVQPTDLNLLVNQVLEDLQVSRQEIHPDVHIPRPLPTLCCDSVLIQEVLINLLSNALKYTDKPQPWIEIGYLENDSEGNSETNSGTNSESEKLLGTSDRPSSPVLYIRDNGIGIRDRHLQTIFRLFKRLHEQHLYGGGTGAGLTIAKKIIERHGGCIWVESIYGQGSTFYFTLK